MSGEQTPGSAETPPASQPARTVRRRRPTHLPPDETRHNEVRILRPSEVPQREPLPDYAEPEERRIIARDVPLEELHELDTEMCRNVVIPSFLTARELMQEATHVPCLVSFRSTNYVEPENRTDDDECASADQGEEKPLSEDIQSFIKRNSVFIGKKVHGCTAYTRESEKSVWDLVIEAPEDSLYAGGIFFAEIRFNEYNSYKTPFLKFKTLLLHPSLSGNGEYDLRGLVQYWGRFATMNILYKYITDEMRDLEETIKKKTLPQIENYAQPNLARLASENWKKFEDVVRAYTQRLTGQPLSAECDDFTEPADMCMEYTNRHGWRRANTPEIDVVGV